MKRIIPPLLALSVVASIAMLTSCSPPSATTSSGTVNVASGETTAQAAKSVDFALPDLDGKSVNLSDYRGKVVLVDVWATWCHFCVNEVPDLIAIQRQAHTDGTNLQILGVSVDQNRSDVPPFVKQTGMNYPVLYGDNAALKPLGTVTGLPTKFIVDEHGTVVEHIVGAKPRAELEQILAKYVTKTP